VTITTRQLRGYLLEESLAWLMRHSGYDLLVHKSQDPDELDMKGSVLCVRGRGTTHQVDVLGEFAFTPAFSLPVRLFLEAKHHGRRCGLDVVRNAHGVLADVNQNYVTRTDGRPRRRFQYCYALFSASGFSPDAEAFAIAHQISLVDLSTPSFDWLLTAIADCADRLREASDRRGISTFPVNGARHILRNLLGTSPITMRPAMRAQTVQAYSPVLGDFAALLQRHGAVELLIGFPPAPFILPMIVDDRRAFVSHAIRQPSHRIWIDPWGETEDAGWTAGPVQAAEPYRLSFTLPAGIDEWITENEQRRRSRARTFKGDFLATITIYFQAEGELHVCHLRYEPGSLRRPS
jgi:hypothetical protein